MALAEVNFFSQTLMRTVPFYAILPCDKTGFDGKREENTPFKTLYLLHGIFGNYTDWITGTRILRWATDYGLAVIMPSGDNRFYTYNKANGEDYAAFIEELVYVTRDMFRLSHDRKDTFVGGLSMGGYGAITNGLRYPHLFSRIIGLSSALHFPTTLETMEDIPETPDCYPFGRTFLSTIFGDVKNLKESDKNPVVQAKRLADSGQPLPVFYLSCGVDDELYSVNEAFAKTLQDLGYDVVWKPGPGAHEWDFWDRAIENVIRTWLPLENRESLGSGNIGPDRTGD
ncbi:alpha/beta hydrolase [Faecalibaculum rodentium]|uniref:alpha/beta hydrolase n=1 Tax=Faecalibaculum rodentium TaxID=1702221 RepID=UPI0023F26E5C|nr:alpha/beta hydrolase-fold protein [Faecalibaculum rodentium]